MSNLSNFNQRDTYKLVQRLTSGKFTSSVDLLQSLVRDIVAHKDFGIIGGRVWKLNPVDGTYVLAYQFGSVKKIPDDYKMLIEDNPVFKEIIKERTVLNYETDPLLRESGIEIYSVTGVGEIIKHQGNRYYKYLLGFNAPQILQSFFEILAIISSVVTIAIRDLNAKEEHKKIYVDIGKASEIQRNLLPDHYMEFHDYKIYGACIPDEAVGGDYFDYLKQPDNLDERLGILISDCASKGLPAAVQALFVSGAIRMGMSFSTRISHLMSRMNNLIFDTFPYERFVTLFYCELTLSSDRLVLFSNAGHCSPIHYRPALDNFKFLNPTGGFLGLVRDQRFEVENIRMHPGDILVLYTDGISEAHSKTNELYGEENICEVIRKYHYETPKNIVLQILEDVHRHSVDGSYTDDKTIVVIKRDKSANDQMPENI